MTPRFRAFASNKNRYKSAYTILESNQDIMHRMAAAWLEREKPLAANEISSSSKARNSRQPSPRSSGVDPGTSSTTQKVPQPEGGLQARFSAENQPSPA